MSVESRSPLRSRRRATKEPERPDYSEPDFSSWAARLEVFTPAVPVTEPVSLEPAPAAPAPAGAVAVQETPAAPAADERPSLEQVLETLLSFDGALCVAVVDSETGMI